MKVKYYLFFMFLSLNACHLMKDNIIWIDNPSSRALIVTIYNNTYLIPALAGIEISLEDGTYDIDVSDDSTKTLLHHYDEIKIKKNGILNITNETYVLVNQAYVTKPNIHLNTKKIKNEISMGAYTYKGDISLVGKDRIFIQQCWTYGLKEVLSPYQEQNVDYAMITKIYRKVDFETDFRRNAGREK